MCGGGEDRHVEIFFEIEKIAQQIFHCQPLVVTEVIDEYEKEFFPGIKEGEDTLREEIMAHQRRPSRGRYPPLIVVAYEATELKLSLTTLQSVHLGKLGVFLHKQTPLGKLAIERFPILKLHALHELHRGFAKSPLVIGNCSLSYNIIALKRFFEREQKLIRIHRFNQKVDRITGNRLVHQLLLFALRNHYHRERRILRTQRIKCLEPRKTRHIFI